MCLQYLLKICVSGEILFTGPHDFSFLAVSPTGGSRDQHGFALVLLREHSLETVPSLYMKSHPPCPFEKQLQVFHCMDIP